jgi:hypothetical protein
MTTTQLLKIVFARTFVLIALTPAILTIVTGVRSGLLEVWGRYYFKYSYIEVINTPSYSIQTKDILEEFDSLAPGKIISFDKIKKGRPIRILEMTRFHREAYPDSIGLAWPGFFSCDIRMRAGENPIEYREALIHEYLHCMGYDHSKDPTDLMYYSLMLVDKEENIRQYAIKVWRKFYE